MAKKFGKFLLATAVIGTAAAGAYYFLKKKKEEEAFDFDAENSDGSESTSTSRNYVPLNFEKAGEKVNVFVSKAGDVLEKTVDMVKQKVGGATASDDVVEDYLDDEDDELDIEPLDLDDEVVNASPETVEVVEDIISDETV